MNIQQETHMKVAGQGTGIGKEETMRKIGMARSNLERWVRCIRQ
jgi:hypothetical protein